MMRSNYHSDVMTDCVCALKCRLGEFYPDKDYGSEIRPLASKDEKDILTYACRALAKIDGVFIHSVQVFDDAVKIKIYINDIEREIKLTV